MLQYALILALDNTSDYWVVDSRASCHATPHRKFFHDDVVGVILSEEMQRKSTGETSGDVLTMESRGRQNERGRSPGNHGKSKKGRSKSRFKKIEC